MLSYSVIPSTLGGIKSLAKDIKRSTLGLKHAAALDQASIKAGFQNFRHAQNVLKYPAKKPSFELYLSACWRDKTNGTAGQEILVIQLSAPWEKLVSRVQLGHDRHLRRMRPEGPDHLSVKPLCSTQQSAKKDICGAARSFQFIDATKLRPSGSRSRVFPGGDGEKSIPGMDHWGAWFDPESGRFLLTDEPYEPTVARREEERRKWARKYGVAVERAGWPGMYAPQLGSKLYLVSSLEHGVPVAPILSTLERLPQPVAVEEWTGQSVPYVPPFISPGTLQQQIEVKTKAKEPRTPAKPGTRRASVAYSGLFVGAQRRPAGKMSLEAHEEVGTLLGSVLSISFHRKGVENKLNEVRSELDEWVQREYDDSELSLVQLNDLYYCHIDRTYPKHLGAEEIVEKTACLLKAKSILSENYPDCRPLLKVLEKLDKANRSLLSWGSRR